MLIINVYSGHIEICLVAKFSCKSLNLLSLSNSFQWPHFNLSSDLGPKVAPHFLNAKIATARTLPKEHLATLPEVPFPTARQVNLPACSPRCPFNAERQAGSCEYQIGLTQLGIKLESIQPDNSRGGRSYH